MVLNSAVNRPHERENATQQLLRKELLGTTEGTTEKKAKDRTSSEFYCASRDWNDFILSWSVKPGQQG